MSAAKFTAEQVQIIIAKDDSTCPPWFRSFDYYGTEAGLRAFILGDANRLQVRHTYTALADGRAIKDGRFYWQVWRTL